MELKVSYINWTYSGFNENGLLCDNPWKLLPILFLLTAKSLQVLYISSNGISIKA